MSSLERCPLFRVPLIERFHCTWFYSYAGFIGISEQQCEAKGCCWYPLGHEPWCFYPTASFPVYKVTGVNNSALGVRVSVMWEGGEGRGGKGKWEARKRRGELLGRKD